MVSRVGEEWAASWLLTLPARFPHVVALTAYVHPALEQLAGLGLARVAVDSQVVRHAPLTVPVRAAVDKGNGTFYAVATEDLPNFVNQRDWHLGTSY